MKTNFILLISQNLILEDDGGFGFTGAITGNLFRNLLNLSFLKPCHRNPRANSHRIFIGHDIAKFILLNNAAAQRRRQAITPDIGVSGIIGYHRIIINLTVDYISVRPAMRQAGVISQIKMGAVGQTDNRGAFYAVDKIKLGGRFPEYFIAERVSNQPGIQ